MAAAETTEEDDVKVRLSRNERQALKAYCVPSDDAGIAHLAGHLALIAMAGVTVVWASQGGGWAAALPTQVVLGILLVFLFAPLHETIHRTAFKSRWLNDTVATVTGTVLVLPPKYFRAFHLEHHRYTQIEGRDPELPGKRISSLPGYLLYASGLLYWKAAVTGLVARAHGKTPEPFLQGRTGERAVIEARFYLTFYAALAAGSVAFGSWAAVTYWVIPVLLGQPFLRLYLLAEHFGCPFDADMFRNTRTMRTNAAVRFLAWNMPYHVEHHAFMAVPFHRLAEVHERFKDKIQVMQPGYLAYHRDTVKTLSA